MITVRVDLPDDLYAELTERGLDPADVLREAVRSDRRLNLHNVRRLPAVDSRELTPIEWQVLGYLGGARHQSFLEIAERLHITREAVKSNVLSVYRKLEVNSRAEAVEHLRQLDSQALLATANDMRTTRGPH